MKNKVNILDIEMLQYSLDGNRFCLEIAHTLSYMLNPDPIQDLNKYLCLLYILRLAD